MTHKQNETKIENDYKYNTIYKDFTGIGGDCTNFVSQILGDKEGGGLKTDGTWYCNYSNGKWVEAIKTKQY